MRRVDSLAKTLMLGGIGGQEEKGTTEDEVAGWHHHIQLRLKPREDSSGAETVGCHPKDE